MTIEILFANYTDSTRMVANGSAEIGTLLVSQSAGFLNFDLGTKLAFLQPLVKEVSNVYFKQPPLHKFRIPILAPFSNLLWGLVIGFLLIANLLLSFVVQGIIEQYAGRLPLQIIEQQSNLSFKIGTVKLILTQFFTLIFIIYNAKVLSAVMMNDVPIKTLDDLIKYKYEFSSYSPVHIDRMFADQRVRNTVLSRVRYPDTYAIKTDMMRDVLKDNFTGPPKALLAHSDGLYPQAIFSLGSSQDLCLVSSFQSSVKTARSYLINKDSKLRERINICILHLMETGLNHRRQNQHKNKFKYACSPTKLKMQPLTVNQVSFAFIVIAVGIFAAIVISVHFLCWRFWNPQTGITSKCFTM